MKKGNVDRSLLSSLISLVILHESLLSASVDRCSSHIAEQYIQCCRVNETAEVFPLYLSFVLAAYIFSAARYGSRTPTS